MAGAGLLYLTRVLNLFHTPSSPQTPRPRTAKFYHQTDDLAG